MLRTFRTVVRAGALAALLVLGPAGIAAASPAVPAPAGVLAADPTPGAGEGSMPGMHHHGSAGTSGTAGDRTGDHTGDHGGMSGMPGGHQDGPAVSRPVAWVVGTFIVVNGLMLAAAAVLRRRAPRRRTPGRRVPPVTA